MEIMNQPGENPNSDMEKKPEAVKNPDLCRKPETAKSPGMLRKPEVVKKPEEIKIAFHLNTLTHGGAERVVTNLANRFAAEGYQVFVATEWTDEDEFVLDERVHRIHVGLREGDEKRNRPSRYLRRIRYLEEFMEEYRPDVVVAFARLALFRALMAKKKTGVPVVVCVRIDPRSEYRGARNFFQIKKYMKTADGAVFQTKDAEDYFRKDLTCSSTIILNPITPKYLGLPPVKERNKTIVNAARLVAFKNQVLLVRAFSSVHEKHPDYDLKIYGPDSGDGTREKILQTIAECHLEGVVHLMGNSDALEKELPQAALFAYSSDYEGLPNSLLEAMAMGLPCVSTDCPCGGPGTLIQNGENGILVPVGDAEALAKGMLALIEHPERAAELGRKAAKIAEIASTDRVFEAWQDYLLRVMAGQRNERR